MNSKIGSMQWQMTPEAFEQMLAWLDPDLTIAAEKYERIREKLIKLFEWRNCPPGDEHADLVIDRVTRRLTESGEIAPAEPYSYFHGTALNVCREYWRRQQKHRHEDVDGTDPMLLATADAEELAVRDEEHQAEQRQYGCMRLCLNELPDETREFIVSYHYGENKKESRKRLAEAAGTTLNILRIRACRLRAELQACVDKCLRRKA